MRDIKTTEIFVEKLRTILLSVPEQRIGQVICNALEIEELTLEDDVGDTFYRSDEDVLEQLDIYLDLLTTPWGEL